MGCTPDTVHVPRHTSAGVPVDLAAQELPRTVVGLDPVGDDAFKPGPAVATTNVVSYTLTIVCDCSNGRKQMTLAISRRLAYLGVSVRLTGLFTSCAGATPPPIPASTPVPTTAPGAPPPPTFTEDQANNAAQQWVDQNDHLLQPDIGWAIADWAATFTGTEAALRVPITAAGKQWLDGQVESELVWTGGEVTLPPESGER